MSTIIIDIKGNKRIPYIIWLSFILFLSYSITLFWPQVKSSSSYIIIANIFLISWLVTAFINKPSFFLKIDLFKLELLVFIIISILLPLLFGKTTVGLRYIMLSHCFFYYIIYRYNNEFGYSRLNELSVLLNLPFIIITTIRTYTSLNSNPYISRSIKSEGYHTDLLRSQGISGYELIYSLLFICILLFYIITNKNKFKINFIQQSAMVIFFLLFIATILKSNYFTALSVFLASVLIIILLNKSHVLIKFTILSILTFAILFLKPILIYTSNFLIDFLSRGITVDRLMVINQELMGFQNSESLISGRSSTISTSINTLLANPIFGVSLKHKDIVNYIGNHSFFFDTFALFGFLGGMICLLISLKPFIKQSIENYNTIYFSITLSVLTAVIILFTMNNLTPSIGYSVFFIYPVTINYLKKVQIQI